MKGSAGGVDNVEVEEFGENIDANLDDLLRDISDKTYIPKPYRQVSIPKEKGGRRILGLPAVRDKVVQVAVKILIEPLFEKMFLNVSYAYRPQKGPLKAIRKARHLIVNEKRDWITLCDIDRYFDTIPHEPLLQMFTGVVGDEYIVHLTELWLRMGKITGDCTWHDRITGTPQGGVISPLLANLYLHPLDVMMTTRNYGYIRYADDFIILSKKEGEAFRALDDVRNYIVNTLKIRLNPGACVKKVSEGFEYLGIWFNNGELTISNDKLRKLKNDVQQAVRFTGGHLDMDHLTEVTNGIGRYYAQLIGSEKLEMIDWAMYKSLKEKCVSAFITGAVGNKQDLREWLMSVQFLTEAMQERKNILVTEIIDRLRRTPKSGPEAKKASPEARKMIRRERTTYRKLESRGMELIVSKPGIFLGKTRNTISVKEKGKKVNEVKLDQLKNILILSQGVAISSNVIAHCAMNNISLDFIGRDGKPYALLQAPFFQTQQQGDAQMAAFLNGKASLLARLIVHAKITNQMYLIKYHYKYRKNTGDDFNIHYGDSIGNMEKLAGEALELPAADHEILRGLLFSTEGRAAGYYWKQVGLLLNDYISFEGRVRQGASDTVNCLLNYGYGILYARIWEAVTKARLNPYISFLHKPQHGKPTLIFDLIEEFRQQAVDRVVFAMISKGEEIRVENGMLDAATRRRLAEKVSMRLQTVIRYKKKETRLTEIIEAQARMLSAFLLGEVKKYKPYISAW
ncbi:MAG: CRISPR-associated endonuclease Cas1 [Bacteroidales bacterium]|nr:CRISPR-associated endonuclease Cas1 [Bacteroidales bacterium]